MYSKSLFGFIVTMSFFVLSVGSAADLAKGKDLYQKCVACHGSDGLGKKSMLAPMLAGQYAWYTLKQLQDIKNKVRVNANVNKMYPFVKSLSDEEMTNISAYVESLAKK